MNYFFIAIAIIFIIYILRIVKHGQFSIEESIFWVAGSLVCLFLAIFPKTIDKIAVMLKVAYPPSLLFLVVIIFLLFLIFRNTKKIGKQNEKVIELAQRCSILEYEIKEIKGLEDKNNEKN